MNEGKATLGVWLPIALADIQTMLFLLYRIQLANPKQLKVPERSDILASWCLPMLSKSLKADEEERKAWELFDSVKKLKSKYSQDSK